MTSLASPKSTEGTSARSHPAAGDKTVSDINALLNRESAKTRLRRLAVSSANTESSGKSGQKVFNPLCTETTLTACKKVREQCTRAHFEPIKRQWTDPALGYCSYLNLCYGDPLFQKNPSLGGSEPGGGGPKGGTKECRYQHFQVVGTDQPNGQVLPGTGWVLNDVVRKKFLGESKREIEAGGEQGAREVAQWVNCDLRRFDYSLLGQFHVIVADPAWDIHMSLPYGTITDDEMRNLPIRALQPDWGILCLWVTGRAMEVGRVVFAHWGYRRVDELVWVKVNQLQRLIRTGRTGHWLNHTCEHLLVALKLPEDYPRDAPIPWDTVPSLRNLRKNLDTDVVVAEVRETSRKPEEVYGVIERLAEGGRKLELFGRKHNVRKGWVTLGNQLGDSQIAEPDMHARLVQAYPKQKFNLVANPAT